MKTTTKSIKDFTLVKPTTKQANNIKWYFENVNKGDIYDCYVSPSYAKVRAFNRCVELAKAYNAYTYKITGANCSTFTFQFAFYRKDKKTGDITHYIANITKDNDYLLATKTIKYDKDAMKIDDILREIKSLACSQGFYGRLYRDLMEVKENDKARWKEVVATLEAQCFKTPVDMVLYFEQ